MAIIMARHLLSKLTCDAVIVNEEYKQANCPCSFGEKLEDSFGDTSMGCEEGWHGDVDIFAPVPVTVFPSTPNSDWENPLKTQQDQLKAQAIVYSFLQRNRQRENQELTTLCPAIGLSDTEMIVYWYDCKKDIMLQTPKLPFLNDECDEFYGSTILLLWFVLNNKSFCSGVTASMLATQFKADFYQHVGVDIQLYQDVKAPCKVDYGFTVHWEEDLNTDDTRYIDTVKVQAGLALPLPVLLDL